LNEQRDLLLKVEDLKTVIPLDEGDLVPVNRVSFELATHETLGVVGESGCGKSVTAQSIMRIVPHPGRSEGAAFFRRQDGLGADSSDMVNLISLHPEGREIRSIRGNEIAMIFQEPMTSFSPLHTIGFQIMEAIFLHRTQSRNEAREITMDLLNRVGIPNATQNVDSYPHQLSGGMRQRAMIAMALSCNPSLLFADEPTTALDVTVQAQVLELMRDLQQDTGMAIIFITHNLGVIAEVAQRVAVMYLGEIVEYTSVDDLFFNPLHPYTQLLLKSIPKVGKKARVRLESIEGTVPLPLDLPDKCSFMPRCPFAMKGVCDTASPPLIQVEEGHLARCYLYRDKLSDTQAAGVEKRAASHGPEKSG
jgi:oligopeptide/dipeptide ABC transporter ATP-binding protein